MCCASCRSYSSSPATFPRFWFVMRHAFWIVPICGCDSHLPVRLLCAQASRQQLLQGKPGLRPNWLGLVVALYLNKYYDQVRQDL